MSAEMDWRDEEDCPPTRPRWAATFRGAPTILVLATVASCAKISGANVGMGGTNVDGDGRTAPDGGAGPDGPQVADVVVRMDV